MPISIFLNGQNCQQVIYSKEDVFEKFIVDNADTIFGSNLIYVNLKHKIGNSSLGGTIPDGVLINLSDLDNPEFYLAEVELQSHDFRSHIYPQIDKFFDFFSNAQERNKLTERIYSIIRQDDILQRKIQGIIGTKEIYRFLKDTLENSQNIMIIIDGAKPEIENTMKSRIETWGRWVDVQIVKHFRDENHTIITMESPFQNLKYGDVAVSNDIEKSDTPFTEEFHLDGCEANVRDTYGKLKSEFLSVKSTLRFNPVKYYVGIRDIRNIAAIRFQKGTLLLEALLPENEVNRIVLHHKIRLYSSRSPMVEINDTTHWEEIQKLINQLIAKYQEIE